MRSKRTLIFKKVNNRGMSLVEVIVAITILGLVAVPVLHSLTTAMVYNQKARTRQEMTLTAESIMETFKGYDLDELKARFTTGGAGIEGIRVADASDTGVYDANPDTGTGFHYTYSSAPLPEPTVGDVYTFSINDMKADNGQFYDVTITATPNSTESVMVQEDMESTRDAVFKGDRAFDTSAVDKAFDDFKRDANKDRLKDYFNGLSSHDSDGDLADPVVVLGATELDLRDGTKVEQLYDPRASVFYVKNYIKLQERELIFDITKNGSGEYVVTPRMVYKYYLKDFPYYLKKRNGSTPPDPYGPSTPSGNTTEFRGESKTLDHFPDDGSYLEFSVDLSSVCTDGNIYKNPDTAGLNRLIIYYYPQYNLDEGKDKIIVNNTANIPKFQCYILKQRAEDINDSNTKTKESRYKGTVVINDSTSSFEVFHNFDYNIGEGSSTPSPSISGASATHSYTKEVSGGTTLQLVNRFTQQEVLSYTLTLEVAQGEGANRRVITSLESTMNENIK